MNNQQENIQQLQNIEQNMQQLTKQRQQVQMQAMEINSACEELEKTETAYKILGNIMVATDKNTLQKELKEKKERLDIRVKSIEKQETALKEQAKKLREEVLKEMQAGKKQ